MGKKFENWQKYYLYCFVYIVFASSITEKKQPHFELWLTCTILHFNNELVARCIDFIKLSQTTGNYFRNISCKFHGEK